jgi:hypothetical protein
VNIQGAAHEGAEWQLGRGGCDAKEDTLQHDVIPSCNPLRPLNCRTVIRSRRIDTSSRNLAPWRGQPGKHSLMVDRLTLA